MITAAQVKDLREKTGAGMMDCKKALTETNGDMEKAIEYLREKGIAKAAKKSGRIAAEGLVECYISEDGKTGAIVEVNAETDFVAKNQEFKDFVMDVAKQIVEKNPADVEALLAQESISEAGKTVQEVLTNKIATIGENMNIRRFARFESEGLVAKYIHGDGKIAVLIEVTKNNPDLAKDICMQIAAARPEFVRDSEVPEERVAKEMEILKVQAMNEGKPEAIAEKMVQGRLKKFYAEICLVDQEFVKKKKKKISDILKENDMDVVRFVRFEKVKESRRKKKTLLKKLQNN